MATNPGLFTVSPWQRLGNLKYLVLAPWVLHGCHKMATAKELGETDVAYLSVFPFMLLRILHSQVWLTISRLVDARGNRRRIVERGIEFEQVDRENNWFHSLHHTQFRTNYSLYMPFYDYIYNTMDKSSSTLYESMLKISKEKCLDVVHLTHLTDHQSIYHLRPGFSMFAARGYNQSNWSMITILSPLSWLIAMLTWAFSSSPFAVDTSVIDKKLNMQTWAIPRYSFHYHLKRENKAINDLIGKAIHEADRRGAKVFSLGLLNQVRNLNGNRERYQKQQPKLRIRIVDGSSLAAVIVSNSVAPGTDQVILAGNLDKVARAVAMALCKRNVKVTVINKASYYSLNQCMPKDMAVNLLFSENTAAKVWIIGEGLEDSEQELAMEGTRFIPCSQFPPRMIRKDCIYLTTPAMNIPRTLLNVQSCEVTVIKFNQ
ncbi:hypothetical protein OsI_07314 [Oryza sativa Indica Group]|uniref:Very-long-chain aldehyde decarbonylase CER1-like C-terminal domain-containing protein n=1 Tax=Oryza sativa subsp. indica TaxID=39946 RepID=B8AIB0_ORYSI|nr:hypothetical protein OsI_07314 [Oryza sativa Indica Group]